MKLIVNDYTPLTVEDQNGNVLYERIPNINEKSSQIGKIADSLFKKINESIVTINKGEKLEPINKDLR